jgi:outer membrane protein assembly factor BamB
MRLTIVALLFFACPLVADDWPGWLGPKRDGYWRETGIVEKFPEGGPKVLWRQPCGIGYAGPAVTQGKVFLPDRLQGEEAKTPKKSNPRAGIKGTDRLLCLEESTGKEIWKFEYAVDYRVSYPAGTRCTPIVDGELVFWLGTMGDLYAIDVKTGKPVWEKHLMKEFEATLPVWGFASHPLADGDKLIVLVGGSDGHGVVAFDKKSGKVIWKALSINGDPGYNSPVIFEVHGKRVLIVWHSHAVVGLDPETGKKQWEYKWEIEAALTVPTARLVNKTQLFLTSFYNGSLLLDIGGETPKVVWKSKSKGGGSAVNPENTVDLHSIMPTPLIEGDTIYGVCSYGELRGLELQTGKRLWQTHEATIGKSGRWANAFLIPNGDRTFLFNEQGELIIAKLSPKGYSEIDRVKIIEPTNKYAAGRTVVWSHPAFANKNMYVRNDKEIVAVSLKK